MNSYNEYKSLSNLDKDKIDKFTDKEIWESWRRLTNMTPSEITSFLNSKESKSLLTGTSYIDLICKMINTGSTYDAAVKNWNSNLWEYCKTTTVFISKTLKTRKKMVGNPFERDGEKTIWLKSLLIKGHDPRKPLKKI